MSSSKGSRPRSGNFGGNKNPAPNAWSRPLKTRPPPGLGGPPSKASQSNNSSSSSSNSLGTRNSTGPSNSSSTQATPDEVAYLRERFLHLSLSMVGQHVTLTQTNGAVFEGVFHTSTPFSLQPVDKRNMYVLKAVQVVKQARHNTPDSGRKVENGSTLIIPADRVSSINCPSIRLENGSKEGGAAAMFRTDAEISSTQNNKGRELVAAGSAWTTGGLGSGNGNSRAEALMGALDAPRKSGFGNSSGGPGSSGLRGTIGEWDQFKANKELFNVSATYDETIYTTELDKSQINFEKRREAERLAHEIESSASTNIHIAEERNQQLQGDYDEEFLYSGVIRNKSEVMTRPAKGETTSAAPTKKMNYAAAAAAAKPEPRATAPPGFPKASPAPKEEVEQKEVWKEEDPVAVTEPTEVEQENDPVPDEEVAEAETTEPEVEVEANPTEANDVVVDEPQPQDEEIADPPNCVEPPAVVEEEEAEEPPKAAEEIVPETAKAEEQEEREVLKKDKSVAKLNANAKVFTFNPTAKTFTPSGSFAASTPAPAPASVAPEHSMVAIDPGMPPTIPPYVPSHHGAYIHPAMMQPAGMVPIMNTYPAIRYPGPYPGMDHIAQAHPQQMPQHMQPQQQPHQMPPQPPQGVPEGAVAPSAGDEQPPAQPSQESQPPQQPQPGVPVQQHYPPAGYYATPPMHPRPGAPVMGGYHHQLVGAPQQIPLMSGGYRPIPYGMIQHPPQMRGPNGAPYFPNGPPHYQPHMEDDYRGGGRGRRGGGRRSNSKRGGRGGRGFYPNNGRQTPQQPEHTPSAPPTADGPTPREAAEGARSYAADSAATTSTSAD